LGRKRGVYISLEARKENLDFSHDGCDVGILRVGGTSSAGGVHIVPGGKREGSNEERA